MRGAKVSEPVHIVVVTDEESGHQALYVGGELIEQDTTIYACDITRAADGKTVRFSHIVVNMPEDAIGYPSVFDECMLWNPVMEVK